MKYLVRLAAVVSVLTTVASAAEKPICRNEDVRDGNWWEFSLTPNAGPLLFLLYTGEKRSSEQANLIIYTRLADIIGCEQPRNPTLNIRNTF